MRLICPNCDAQYEVPDDVMPTAGRDVQCSNCGQTWFQHHPDHTPQEDIEGSDLPAPDEEVAPPPPPPPPPQTPTKPERKQLDPAVADILRQEAEAEQAARKMPQSSGLESQPDLGLDGMHDEDDAERRARQARERMARLRGDDAPEAAASGGATAAGAAAASLGSRRDLLPDIEEINSTLRSGTARTGAGAADVDPQYESPTRQRNREGFRTGFLTVMMVFIVLMMLYIYAPRLATSVPALEGPLRSYVSSIDQGRVWLDTTVQNLLKSLDSAAQESNK